MWAKKYVLEQKKKLISKSYVILGLYNYNDITRIGIAGRGGSAPLN